ncbi:RusA family crossover junction endodeoxyribonuclease [Jonquetella anthropi]|uniref:RusA family crossover junction endodeoxyribonuclease n=1 Tax=Jonquetella anthropi TaxID=428712 RepID=UPI0001B90F0D|nr:RusA family crossover junction endodeoxyribonuclease [Jonquetella anthropi]EEX48661.1 crossover junction endodeoxyribonuclease RusA [Jonquetella anthropi E3_33 E1]
MGKNELLSLRKKEVWKIENNKIFEIEIPGLPPTVNHFYRTSRTGVRYKTAEGKAWQAGVVLLMRTANKNYQAYAGEVGLYIDLMSTDKRRWDVDNRIKALQDCLASAGVIKNDTQVIELHARRVHGDDEKTNVMIYKLAEK